MNLPETLARDTGDRVPALARGLGVRGMFSVRTRSLSMPKIAAQLGVTTSAVYRILSTLTDRVT
ncbi:helix-turn-helix domain-containing protein [Pseudomonas asplenii]|uniref:helix-turn-helix domain-containing protein n=1 Tax=Pseudomonas asplenii TaxID=53407 RepID=UPI0003768FBD|nr:helix-turn-helix domain-containing protein [Pseudomonas fuscovaginae]